ncbi:MAG: hypothetical protein ACJAWF_002320, partial [Candidatus Azotimanducaceae bacterium]
GARDFCRLKTACEFSQGDYEKDRAAVNHVKRVCHPFATIEPLHVTASVDSGRSC